MADPKKFFGGLNKVRERLMSAPDEARLSELLSHGGDKALPLMLPRANLSSDFVNQQAERVARQMLGEHVVSGKPKEAFNLAGRSKKESQRVKGLNYKLSPTGTVAQEVPYTPRRGDLKVAIPGDQTVSNKILDEVNGFPIDSVQEGGAYYGLGQRHLADPEFWKSNEEPAKRMQSKVDRVAELYEPNRVIGSHLAMGPMSNNFAMHLADANLRAVDWSKAQPNKINIFDSIIAYGYKDPKTGEMVKFPNWPGLADREGALTAMKEDANLRKWFNDRMKTPKVTKPLGLPNGLDIQYAITEPRLRDMEINMTGLMTGELQPGALVEAAGAPHNTYSHRILGKAGGPQEVLTPFVIDFPDAAQHIASTKKPADFTGTIQKVFPHQLVDDQYLNQYGEYRDRIKELTGQKEGGAVDMEAADARLAQAIQARMAKGGAVDMEAADARLQAAIQARMGGEKVAHMAGGGGKLKFFEDIAKKFLVGSDVLPAAEKDANLAKMLEVSKVKERLYHATPQDIKEFKPGGKNPKVSGYATWLSNDPKRQPAMHNISGGKEAEFREGTNVMPVYVQAKNPMLLDDKDMLEWAQAAYAGGSKQFPQLMPKKWADEVSKDYDSVILADPFGLGDAHEVIMFDPKKIKSAISNRGTYDITEPDISKAKGGGVHMAGAGGVFKALGDIGKKFLAEPPQAEVLKLAQQRAALPKTKHGLGLPADNTPEQRAAAMKRNTDAYHGSKQDITGAFRPGYDDNLAFVTKSPDFANKWIGKGKMQKRVGDQAKQELKSAEDMYRDMKSKHMDYDSLSELKGDEFHSEYDRRNAIVKAEAEKEFGLQGSPDKIHSTVYPLTVEANKIFNPETDMDVMAEFFAKNNTPQEIINHFEQGNYLVYETKPVVNFLKSKGYDSMRLRESSGDDYPTIAVFNPESIRGRFAAHDPFRRDAATAAAMGVLAPDLMAEEKKKAKGGLMMAGGGDPLDQFSPPRYRSAGRRPESQQDRKAAANMPLDFVRGLVSGIGGAPGDIESLIRMLPGLDERTVLPTSEDIEKRLPFRSDTPAGQAASGLGTLAGGFYTGPGAPIRLVGGLPKAVVKAGKDFTKAAGQPATRLDVYHGSPHKYDKFDASKIGTGEGAQAYGHGIYTAENPGIAQGYADRLGGGQFGSTSAAKGSTADRLSVMFDNDGSNFKKGSRDISTIAKNLAEKTRVDADGLVHHQFKDGSEWIGSPSGWDVASTEKYLYKVDLPDEQIAKMLDWDKPLSEQPDVMRALKGTDYEVGVSQQEAEKIADMRLRQEADEWAEMTGGDPVDYSNNVDWEKYVDGVRKESGSIDSSITGKDLHRMVMRDEGYRPDLFDSENYQVGASETLRGMGIPGIKYLDATSRDAGKGTRNFVTFPGEEQSMTILERNGQPMIAPAPEGMAHGGLLHMADAGRVFKDGLTTSGGTFSPEELGVSASDLDVIDDKTWNAIKRNAPGVYEEAKQKMKDEASQLKSAKGIKDFALRVGASYAGAIPDLANFLLMAPDAVFGTELASEKPWFGSQQYLDAMNKAGMLGEYEFPIAETVAGILTPAGLIKKGVKKVGNMRTSKETPKKRRGGLAAMAR